MDKGRESYNNSFKKCLQGNDIVTYSTHLLLLKDLLEPKRTTFTNT